MQIDFSRLCAKIAGVKPGCLSLVFYALLCSLTSSPGRDWPQWRGSDRNGITPEKVIAAWPESGPKVLWRAAIGTGFSSFSVSHGRVYTMGNTNDQDTIWCLDANSGNPLWHHTYPSPLGSLYYEGGPGSTPTVDGHQVITIGKWGDVFCLDAAKGSVVWHRDLGKDGVKPNEWGFSGSPLIWRDLVILNAGSAGTALDRRTGSVVWSNGTNRGGYASPVLFKSGGQECVLIFAAKHLIALEPKTGRELWRHPWETGYDTNNPDPLVHGDTIFISSYSRGCALLKVRDGKPEVIYDTKVLYNHLCSGILLGDYLYAFNGEARRQTDLRCLHLPTGDLKWTTKDPAFGSLICAHGRLIVLSDRGELLLAEASPSNFKPLARAQVLGGRCWTPPALAIGHLYIRNAKGDMLCLDLTGK